MNKTWLVGRIIGSAGMNMRSIKAQTGVHMHLQLKDGQQRLVAHLSCPKSGASLQQAKTVLMDLVATALQGKFCGTALTFLLVSHHPRPATTLCYLDN